MAKRDALALLKAEQKELEARLGRIRQAIRLLSDGLPPVPLGVGRTRGPKKRRNVSAATRAKMRAAWKRRKAAQRARS